MSEINHVAIIMDGNGRWALKRNKARNFGHQEGLKNISSLIDFAKKNKIKFLTLFVFSLDNWKRSKKEVTFLFNLLEKFLDKNINELIKKKITVNSIKNNLYTKNIPDPELLIRTGGQNRLSDFMLWQMSYTEIFFIKKLWPDFNRNDFKKILQEYKKIKRNFGSIDD